MKTYTFFAVLVVVALVALTFASAGFAAKPSGNQGFFCSDTDTLLVNDSVINNRTFWRCFDGTTGELLWRIICTKGVDVVYADGGAYASCSK